MKQIFLVSTLFELVCVSAGIDDGAYDLSYPPSLVRLDRSERSTQAAVSERILLLSNNARIIEQTPSLSGIPGVSRLFSRFDRVIVLNDLVTPQHPSAWEPEERDLPMLQRLIRREWELGDESIELILESPQSNPARTLSRVFFDSTLRVHADGLMSYGPTRNQLPLTVGQRMTSLHYLPLVEGLQPLLLSEFDVIPVPLPTEAFKSVVAELSSAGDWRSMPSTKQTGFVIGQYLAAMGLVSFQEEDQLHVEMIERAAASGCERIIFKPHPSAPKSTHHKVMDTAARLNVELEVATSPTLVEVALHQLRPHIIVGSFSTALMTALTVYGIDVVAVGTDSLLSRIRPYHNSNRIPVTIVDWIGSNKSLASADIQELQLLLEAVAYCMQPDINPDFRPTAESFLHSINEHDKKYFNRRRLTRLRLPGGMVQRRNPRNTARIIAKTGYRLLRQSADEIIRQRRNSR